MGPACGALRGRISSFLWHMIECWERGSMGRLLASAAFGTCVMLLGWLCCICQRPSHTQTLAMQSPAIKGFPLTRLLKPVPIRQTWKYTRLPKLYCMK